MSNHKCWGNSNKSSQYPCPEMMKQMAKDAISFKRTFTFDISLRPRSILGGGFFSRIPASYGETIAGLINRKNMALPTAPILFWGNRWLTTCTSEKGQSREIRKELTHKVNDTQRHQIHPIMLFLNFNMLRLYGKMWQQQKNDKTTLQRIRKKIDWYVVVSCIMGLHAEKQTWLTWKTCINIKRHQINITARKAILLVSHLPVQDD